MESARNAPKSSILIMFKLVPPLKKMRGRKTSHFFQRQADNNRCSISF